MSALSPRLPSYARDAIVRFLQSHLDGPPSRRALVGLSGGIDSALVARLLVEAVGAPRVIGVLLRGEMYPEPLRAETRAFAARLGIELRDIPVGAAVAAVTSLVPEAGDRMSTGNVVARLRMTVDYALARHLNALVVGTGNKSELLLGYFTKYGDGGVDLLPIGDLYKTEVRALAADLDLPAAIRARAPSAGFWEGQTDEEELGLPYEAIDRILRGLEELREPEEIAGLTGIPRPDIDAVVARVAQNRHKRRPVPIPKLSLRTVGLDWRD
ncbi:MAG: NAD+ synthase [Thermoplasmata archaeon]|nr:NAD+ synthase [Thermoplasmata archaeon]